MLTKTTFPKQAVLNAFERDGFLKIGQKNKFAEPLESSEFLPKTLAQLSEHQK